MSCLRASPHSSHLQWVSAFFRLLIIHKFVDFYSRPPSVKGKQWRDICFNFPHSKRCFYIYFVTKQNFTWKIYSCCLYLLISVMESIPRRGIKLVISMKRPISGQTAHGTGNWRTLNVESSSRAVNCPNFSLESRAPKHWETFAEAIKWIMTVRL